jgi:hypothetical protein
VRQPREEAGQLPDKGNYCRTAPDPGPGSAPAEVDHASRHGALGALSHKSNAQRLGGSLLTYRGWPDDWLTNPAYVKPRINPVDPEGPQIIGHPLFGPPPGRESYIPMIPIMAPRLVFATAEPYVKARWLRSASGPWVHKGETRAAEYLRPWYDFTDEVAQIEQVLRELLRLPPLTALLRHGNDGRAPWAEDAAIVSMMFRWKDPKLGSRKRSGSRGITRAWIFTTTFVTRSPRLTPLVLAVLYKHMLMGHNLPSTFCTPSPTSMAPTSTSCATR